MPILRIDQRMGMGEVYANYDTGEVLSDVSTLRDSLEDVHARLAYLEQELRRFTERTLDDALRDAADGLRRLAQENDLSNMSDEEFEQAFMQIINP